MLSGSRSMGTITAWIMEPMGSFGAKKKQFSIVLWALDHMAL